MPSKDDNIPTVILTWFIQVTGLAAGIVFGVFSALAWVNSDTAKQQAHFANSQAEHANSQAKTANLLALAALCANFAGQVGLIFLLFY